NAARKAAGVSIRVGLVEPLISTRTVSIALMERDNWLARTVAMLPDSAIAALIASARSCQIVHPTPPVEMPSSRIAAHQSRRTEIVCAKTAMPGASAALMEWPGLFRTLSDMLGMNPKRRSPRDGYQTARWTRICA